MPYNTWVDNGLVDFSLPAHLQEAAANYTFKRWDEGGKLFGQINDIKWTGISKEHTRMSFPTARPDDTSVEWYQKELRELYAKLKSGTYAPGGRRVRVWKNAP